MQNVMFRLWQDDQGFLVSAELIIVATVLVLGVIVGLAAVQNAVVCELNDVAGAISSLNQTYSMPGTWTVKGGGWCRAWTAGSAFVDINQCGGGFIGSDCVGGGWGGVSIGVGAPVSVPSTAIVPGPTVEVPVPAVAPPQPAPVLTAPCPQGTGCEELAPGTVITPVPRSTVPSETLSAPTPTRPNRAYQVPQSVKPAPAPEPAAKPSQPKSN